MANATIYDVAGAARVSLATVSRVLNNPEKVNEENKKIKEKSIHGKLFTNIFGGGTVDTERAFITGFSSKLPFENSLLFFSPNFVDIIYVYP